MNNTMPRRRKTLPLLVGLSVLATSFFMGPIPASAAATTMTIDVTEPSGSAAPNADVHVYYLAPESSEAPVGTEARYVEMASGSSDASGRFAATLDTSMVGTGPANLGDLGTDSNDTFNVLVVVMDKRTNFAAVSYETVTSGGLTLTVAKENPRSRLDPETSASSSELTAAGAHCSIGGVCYTIEARNYRYIRATAQNSSAGLKATFRYTPSSITERQTKIGVGIKFAGGDWEAGGMILEQRAREVTSPWIVSGNYHRYIWANYRWVKKNYWVCDRGYCTFWDAWEPVYFASQLTDDNPNVGPDSPRIGIKIYDQGPFPSNVNYRTKITTNNSGWTRARGQYMSYGFSLSAASFLALTDKATYGSITSMKYTYLSSGCASPKARYVYGNGEDPAVTPVIETACIVA